MIVYRVTKSDCFETQSTQNHCTLFTFADESDLILLHIKFVISGVKYPAPQGP